ncbi:Hsp20/alpha crystallin family protein [Flavihumibacter solisilvae]|uniref:SHSP domain-containing protein n=1 Tax=Flavihumibacter solisilvae TaxID=1349421 RepID=A0A0C1L753_9BACT|nr:Hsp20/alpha crystallin family protein [Flavihumibacter solisilvae]KIC95331.1 hypothetical protein OI18_06945 [Flavihumibacter solisilvae]
MKVLSTKKSRSISRPLFDENQARGLRTRRTRWVPPANVTESSEAYIIKLAVPGLDRHCFNIHCSGKELTVAGKKEEINDCFGKEECEYNFSEWMRNFQLPEDADTTMTQANYRNGELIITIPRNTSAIPSGENEVFIY